MKSTVFWEVLSHWCFASIPAARALRDLGDVEIAYAPGGGGGPLGYTPQMLTWFYARGRLAYGRTFYADWCEGPQTSSWYANAASFVAGELLGDHIRAAEAFGKAALEERALLGRREDSFALAASLAGVSVAEIAARAEQPVVAQALASGNERLKELALDERPSILIENANGDRALFKGLWQKDALVAAAEAMLRDEAAYRQAGPAPF